MGPRFLGKQSSVQLVLGLSCALLSVVACAPQDKFVGTWSGGNGRAVIDRSTVTFYNPRGDVEGTWPVTIVDENDARFDSPLGAGSLQLTASGLVAHSGDLTYTYQRTN